MKKKPNHLRAVIGARPSKKGPPVIEIDASDLTPEGIRAAFVQRFGDECAAWLVRRFRKTIRRYGCFSMHLEAGEEEPNWLQIALAYLRKRSARWAVAVKTSRGRREYRVVWLGARRAPRDLPESIRRH